MSSDRAPFAIESCLCRMVWLIGLAFASMSAACAAASQAPPATTTIPPVMIQCYNLGSLLYTPVAQVRWLDLQVESLSHTSAGQQPHKLSDLIDIASHTRDYERDYLVRADALLAIIGAPQVIRGPFDKAATEFQQPAPGSQSDPLQSIGSIIAEADTGFPHDWSSLLAWLKIARGADAVWAFHLGSLSASLKAAAGYGDPRVALLDTVPALTGTEPVSTPASVHTALVRLIADIAQTQLISLDLLRQTSQSLDQSFEK